MQNYIKYNKDFLKIHNLCLSNKQFLNELKKINNINLFDVTLRDGLQGLNISEQELFTIEKKKNYIII